MTELDDASDEPTREVSTDPTDEPTREVSTDPTEDEILEYDGEAATADSGAEEAYRTRPTIKPVLIWIGIAVVLGGGLAALLNAVPELLGDPQLAAVAVWVVVLVTALVVVRLLARTYVLLRTRYVIDDSTIRSEFHLLYKSRTRQLPFDRVRGFDVEQDRLQSALGIGTVSTLSGGTNHSLGFVEFEHVPKPESVGERIREGIDET